MIGRLNHVAIAVADLSLSPFFSSFDPIAAGRAGAEIVANLSQAPIKETRAPSFSPGRA